MCCIRDDVLDDVIRIGRYKYTLVPDPDHPPNCVQVFGNNDFYNLGQVCSYVL